MVWLLKKIRYPHHKGKNRYYHEVEEVETHLIWKGHRTHEFVGSGSEQFVEREWQDNDHANDFR